MEWAELVYRTDPSRECFQFITFGATRTAICGCYSRARPFVDTGAIPERMKIHLDDNALIGHWPVVLSLRRLVNEEDERSEKVARSGNWLS